MHVFHSKSLCINFVYIFLHIRIYVYIEHYTNRVCGYERTFEILYVQKIFANFTKITYELFLSMKLRLVAGIPNEKIHTKTKSREIPKQKRHLFYDESNNTYNMWAKYQKSIGGCRDIKFCRIKDM